MGTKIRIAGIARESIVDGPGIRFVVFAQGCKHNCQGCHNPETHSFAGGRLVDIGSIMESIDENPLLSGVTLSGGEPFEQAEGLAELAYGARQRGLTVMTYTGYTYEKIRANLNLRAGWNELLENSDILVDGRFELGLRNLLLGFRGSENQRIIDMRQTRSAGKIVLADL